MTTTQPTSQDFQTLLQRSGQNALFELKSEIARIHAEAARKGALSNSRIVFLFVDALETHWRRLVGDTLLQLRRWTNRTDILRMDLRTVAEAQLQRLLPLMIGAAKIDRTRSGFANQTMLASIVERTAVLEDDITFGLRQFDIDMDDTDGPTTAGERGATASEAAASEFGQNGSPSDSSSVRRNDLRPTKQPVTVFFSYSHADENLREQLQKQLAILKRQSVIETWHDRRIAAGDEFGLSIDRHIEEDDIILLLVSPDFLASDYCYEREMRRAMQRHEAHEATVIPVILRPCDWHDAPFGKLQATPRDGKPVTQWSDRDEAFLDVARSLRTAVAGLEGRRRISVTRQPNEPDAREDVLRELLENPPPGKEWRKMSTLCRSIGANEAETTRLLLKIGARRSTAQRNVWALRTRKPIA